MGDKGEPWVAPISMKTKDSKLPENNKDIEHWDNKKRTQSTKYMGT
jgi:hypothetical protein